MASLTSAASLSRARTLGYSRAFAEVTLRSSSVLLITLLGSFYAPQAMACRTAVTSPPPPVLFWSASPDKVELGESVVEVEFVRYVLQVRPEDPDTFLVTCAPSAYLFRVTRAVSGPTPPGGVFLMTGYDFDVPSGPPSIIVGRLSPQEPVASNAEWILDVGRDVPQIHLRLPPQTPWPSQAPPLDIIGNDEVENLNRQ